MADATSDIGGFQAPLSLRVSAKTAPVLPYWCVGRGVGPRRRSSGSGSSARSGAGSSCCSERGRRRTDEPWSRSEPLPQARQQSISSPTQQLKELLTPQRLPSTTAKFLNPMASSLRLTTSSSSDTFHKHQAVSEGGVHAGAGASAQWGVPSPAAFGYLLRCKPAVWWTGRRGPHPHCHLHPRTSGWRWRKPSWGEACWAPWAPPGLKALSQPGKEPTPARRVVNSQDGFPCWRFNIHLVHEPGVASVELQRQLPQAMGQRRKVDSVRPASHQTGPEELRHLQVEAASSCTATHTVKAKFRRSRCSRRKLGPTRCCLKPITYGLLQAPCYLLVPESTRDERERERETLVGGLVSTLLTLIEAAAAGGRMLPDCGSEEGGGEAP